MADSEYWTDKYKSLKWSIGAVIKIPEMIRSIPNCLKLNKCVNMQVKKLSVVIRYVSDLFKTLEVCNKVVEENGGTLKFVPNSNKKKIVQSNCW